MNYVNLVMKLLKPDCICLETKIPSSVIKYLIWVLKTKRVEIQKQKIKLKTKRKIGVGPQVDLSITHDKLYLVSAFLPSIPVRNP